MSGRRDDGYQVRYRLDSSPTRGNKVAVVAAGLVGVAWLAATLTAPPRPAEIVRADPTAVSTSLETSRRLDTGPTFPPLVERVSPIGSRVIPVLGYEGLGWLETRRGTLKVADEARGPQWLFMWADGSTLCVCDIGPGQRALVGYSPIGELTSSVPLDDWPAKPGLRTITDVELDPANRLLYLAWARVGPEDRWSLWLNRIALDTGAPMTRKVAEGRDTDLPGRAASLSMWLSPDARHARLRLEITEGVSAANAHVGTWRVDIGGSEPGEVVPEDEPEFKAGTRCFAEGWATRREFVAACTSLQPDGGELVRVRSSSIDGTVRDVDLGPTPEQLAWIMSGTSGRLFLWAPRAHRLWRIDVPSLDVHVRELLSADAFPEVPEASWPVPGHDHVAWSPRGFQPGSFTADRSPLLGSHDGTVVYAAGYGQLRSDIGTSESTGIWAIDAASLAVVDRWPAFGTYNALGMTPDGGYVVGFGDPTINELVAFGNIGPTMAFHDARLGSVALILRESRSFASFLVPEPDPEPT